MKRTLLQIFPLLALLFLAGACSDDDEQTATPLAAPAPVCTVTHSSIEMSWPAVEGATQYGYKLTDGLGLTVASDVTRATKLAFYDLTPATAYHFSLWAYGVAYSANGTSPVVEVEALTNALAVLPAPELSLSEEGTQFTITWPEIEGAQGYSYVLKGNGVQRGTTTDTTLRLRHLEAGSYTLKVCAMIDADGYEPNGATASLTFEVTKVRKALWTKTGSYTSACYGNTFDAVLTAYDDGSYVLAGWQGVEGYDLDFDLSGQNILLDEALYPKDEATSCYLVPTGLMDNDGQAMVYTSGGFSFLKTTSTKGRIRLCIYYGGNYVYDIFNWEI